MNQSFFKWYIDCLNYNVIDGLVHSTYETKNGRTVTSQKSLPGPYAVFESDVMCYFGNGFRWPAIMYEGEKYVATISYRSSIEFSEIERWTPDTEENTKVNILKSWKSVWKSK